MGLDNSAAEVVSDYFQSLLATGQSVADALRELERAAVFLSGAGLSGLAQTLREVALKQRMVEKAKPCERTSADQLLARN